MFKIICTFPYKNRMFLIDEYGQVWTQWFNDMKRKLEVVKIGDIDLDPMITEENSRAAE